MSGPPLAVRRSAQFRRDAKLMARQGRPMRELAAVVGMLAYGIDLPERYRDHELRGNLKGHRECHIQPDWLLVYRIDGTDLVLELIRTGTHAGIFGK